MRNLISWTKISLDRFFEGPEQGWYRRRYRSVDLVSRGLR
jgi:hypothetical protein